MLVDLIDVQRALDKDEVVPSYQAIVELRTGRLAGFEVLARWQHPEHGAVLPENFISLAETNGLIERLTQQILRKAFQAGCSFAEHLILAVNISPLQLRDLDLAHQIQEIAEQTGFALHRVTVEITESALVSDLENAQKLARRLQEMGCKLALDDFGTGYSSLSHLQALPFNELKVDRSFVADMVDKRECRKIVAAVVGLGHSLGLTTVAEGVETEEQADMLLWLGCEQVQGWLYGRPVPAEKVPEIVAAAQKTVGAGSSAPAKSQHITSLEALPALRLAQLHAIYDSVPVGLCFMDRNLRYVSMNQRYADLNGISLEASIGRSVKEMIPEVYPRIEPYIQRGLRGESIADEEVARPSPKTPGKDLATLLAYQPVWDEAGEVIGLSVAVMDITDCKSAEEMWRESEEHYRLMVDMNPQAPWMLDAYGNVIDVGSKWVEMTGLTKEKSRNAGWLDALHPEDVKRAVDVVRASVRTGTAMDVEYRIWDVRRKDWRWVRARGAPRQGPEGKALFWYGSFEDIDERKQMEEEMRQRHGKGLLH
jgi:PAS domain S-box-containing protein